MNSLTSFLSSVSNIIVRLKFWLVPISSNLETSIRFKLSEKWADSRLILSTSTKESVLFFWNVLSMPWVKLESSRWRWFAYINSSLNILITSTTGSAILFHSYGSIPARAKLESFASFLTMARSWKLSFMIVRINRWSSFYFTTGTFLSCLNSERELSSWSLIFIDTCFFSFYLSICWVCVLRFIDLSGGVISRGALDLNFWLLKLLLCLGVVDWDRLASISAILLLLLFIFDNEIMYV